MNTRFFRASVSSKCLLWRPPYVKQWLILIPVMLTSRLHFLTNSSPSIGGREIPHKYILMLKEDKKDGPSVGGLNVGFLILF
jgi:hypothetical protein